MNQPDLGKLEQIFKAYPEIEAVFLFGSHARGTPRQDSDLDLAIYPDSDHLRERKLDILADLARNGFCNVDLVYFDRSDIVLQFEIVRMNRLVYKTCDFDKGSLFSKVLRFYFDFYPYLTEQRKAYKNRILNDPS